MRNEDSWKRNQIKIARQSGRAYIGADGKEVPAKKPPLNTCLCQQKCRRQCSSKLDDAKRETIFGSYYTMPDESTKNAYLFGCIKPLAPKVQRLDAQKHRKMSFAYFVTIEGQCVSICKSAFAHLHQITNSKIDYILSLHGEELPAARPSRRGRHNNRRNAISNERVQKVIEHISKFPAEISLYSRESNPNRMYLAPKCTVCIKSGVKKLNSSLYRSISTEWYSTLALT